MKIAAEKFFSFFSKATLNGNIPTALVKIENKEMNIWIRSLDNTVAVNAVMKNVDSDNQTWPIKDTGMFLNCLKLFSGPIELQLNTNKLSMFNATKQVDFVLADESFIENTLPKYPNVVYEPTQMDTINTEIFKNILKNKAIVKSEIVKLETDGVKLQIIAGSDKFDTITDKAAAKIAAASVNLSSTADEIFNALNDKVTVGIKSDYPVLFKWETPEYKIQYVAAHIVDVKEE